jgi:carbonic anhydrase
MAHAGPQMSAAQVWERLLAGNKRFLQGRSQDRDVPELRRSLAQGQQPLAAVLCCSDSRVPPEIIFDQSLGDLFVVRTAGLVLEPMALGSLEYAVAHLKVPLLIIQGHEACGAVTAAVQHPDLDEGHITAVVRQISPAVAQARQQGLQGQALVEAATDLHLNYLKETLFQESAIIREAVDSKRLGVIVAKYFFHDGLVQSLNSTF